MDSFVNEVTSRLPLLVLMIVSALLAIYFLEMGIRKLRRPAPSQFDIITPVLRSCFNCENMYIPAPGKAPIGVLPKELKHTIVGCRELLHDERNLPGPEFDAKWSFTHDYKGPEDYLRIGAECPHWIKKARVIQGGKAASNSGG